ncbi:TolC family protein [Amphibiibacter pelophylacis]|uniref:Efflux transporter outer membrane subunit n=1 Tax=Amphibiibacter pelophylacis TaxID=1799477 RepID=A0ACC6NYP8_9BURK
MKPLSPSLASLVPLAAALLLSGCASLLPPAGTPYSAPEVTVPATWSTAGTAAAAKTTASTPADAGWSAFGDPALTRWVDTALERNADIATTVLRLQRAGWQAQMQDIRLPVSASLSSGQSRSLSGGLGSPSSSASSSFGVSYEADLWGKVARQQDAARWTAQATAQDLASARLTVASGAATLYWQIASLQAQAADARLALDNARRALTLVQAQHKAGAVGALELAQAQQAVQAAQVSQSQIASQLQQASTSAALLMDTAPDGLQGLQALGLPVPQGWPKMTLPAVQPDLPAQVLARRPDLQAAELRLRASWASADVTRLSYYPSLSLTGRLGFAGSALLDLLANPVATLGAGLSLPFLNAGQMNLDLKVAQNQYAEAVNTYRQTLYTALGEVADALEQRRQLQRQGELQAASLAQAQTVSRVSEARYRAGSVALKTWLDAQDALRSARASLRANELARLSNHATLIQALGGPAAS